jgi:hypothetical protein
MRAWLPVHLSLMRLVASPEAVAFVREHGGRLFVWTERTGCCSGVTVRLKASTAPDPGREFRSAPANDQIELFFPEHLGRLPDELHLELHGRRRQRIDAYWNGCSWVT